MYIIVELSSDTMTWTDYVWSVSRDIFYKVDFILFSWMLNFSLVYLDLGAVMGKNYILIYFLLLRFSLLLADVLCLHSHYFVFYLVSSRLCLSLVAGTTNSSFIGIYDFYVDI